MREQLEMLVSDGLETLGINANEILIEYPADSAHGDYATNAALVYAKGAGIAPRELAANLVVEMLRVASDDIANIEVAGPGFINFRLSDKFFAQSLHDVLHQNETWGQNEILKGKKIIVEYTDPNPFKEFHIGHLMSNAVGESIARIISASGAETKRACYQGDVGMHVAKAVWGMMWTPKEKNKSKLPPDDASLREKIAFLAQSYVYGAAAYEARPEEKEEIAHINREIYDCTDEQIYKLYLWGREVSLKYFETIYKKLGTKFDYYFFESETGQFGKEIIFKNIKYFAEGERGAIVYEGDESKGLHTRVFINSEGLPTYEAKELGLASTKFDKYPYDTSIVVTGNEVNSYFKVLLDAMAKVFPVLAAKTIHISHGMLRLPSGKMSSRTGDVIPAEVLIADVKQKLLAKIENKLLSDAERDELAEQVAIGAIKYTILRQASGKDIIFDFDQSLSFEGDSGPYLQYTYARTSSLLAKAKKHKIDPMVTHEGTNVLHKKILQFPDTVLRASAEREPHYITTYLIELAREFNAYYANTVVLNDSLDQPYKLALVKMTSQTLKSGLDLLAIPTPERM